MNIDEALSIFFLYCNKILLLLQSNKARSFDTKLTDLCAVKVKKSLLNLEKERENG